MGGAERGQSGGVHPDDEPTARPPRADTPDPAGRTDRQFVALVDALRRNDPRFVRRLSARPPRWPFLADLMVVAGVLATLVLGVVPLALGVQLHLVEMLAVGALGCLLMPVGAPCLVRLIVGRVRPLWL